MLDDKIFLIIMGATALYLLYIVFYALYLLGNIN